MGGKAFKQTQPIHQADVPHVQAKITELLKTWCRSVVLLGSAGKKAYNEPSGDLDFAITHQTGNHIIEFIEDTLKGKHLLNNIFSFPYVYTSKIDGASKSVQVDLMVYKGQTNSNLQYAQWAFYAPSVIESAYSGTHRTELLRSIAKYCNVNIIEEDKKGPTLFERHYFDGTSFCTLLQTFIGKKGQRVKAKSTVARTAGIIELSKIQNILFGEQVANGTMNSFESIFAYLEKSVKISADTKIQIMREYFECLEAKGKEKPIEALHYEEKISGSDIWAI